MRLTHLYPLGEIKMGASSAAGKEKGVPSNPEN
jgi:hypothetical protein